MVHFRAFMTNNAGSNRKRINQRLVAAPANAVLTSIWLKGRGISSKLAGYYASSGWLHRVGDGAFTVQPGTPTWLGAVFGLQQKSKSLHPGGRTALELSGLAHFLPLGNLIRFFCSAGSGAIAGLVQGIAVVKARATREHQFPAGRSRLQRTPRG